VKEVPQGGTSVCIYRRGGGEGVNSVEDCFLHGINYTKVRLNDKVVGLTKLGKNVCCLTSCAL